ncbi:MAG: hypothetical protein JHC26_05185 [Thermofilum sp.]|uniref:BREX system Lon protease-like protein BrxL n=1 Tax=Thermofilum sp. TaxID=1961369 RepID=UPI00258B5082|nr:BREX system Lon protease-like protein BrxL [Thermofilum sp.]MCI4408464.1 hypothetical protein [Thermofilum sp.]
MKLKEYLVPVVQSDDVPPEILVALRSTDIERVKKAWKNANNPHYLIRTLTVSGEAELIGKPSTVRFANRGGATYYVLKYPSGNIYLDVRMVSDELAEFIQTELLRVVVRRQGSTLYAVSVEPLIATPKEERGKELVEVFEADGINLWEIPVIGYGYISPSTKSFFNSNAPDEILNRISRLVVLRFMSTIRVRGAPVHVIELTTPNTGKTTFAVRNIYLLNWGYINETPSFSRLIMDARNGSLGIVFRSNGVFIDEIDKYAKEMKDVISAFLSGMSHGIWKRAKGDRDTPNIKRFIPIYLAGNRVNKSLSKQNTRTYIQNILSMSLPSSEVEALIDRVAITITNTEPINASDYVSKYVISDSYLRGFVTYISKLATKNYKDLGLFSGRMREHANNVYAICTTLNLSTNCEEFAKSVETGWEI